VTIATKTFRRQSLDATALRNRLPAELVNRAQWVAFRIEKRDGKSTKVPIDPKTGRNASVTDPADWGAFGRAVTYHSRTHDSHGVGRVLTADEGLVGIDLDLCRDPDTGEVDAWAADVLARFAGTYAEVTPSGTGVRIFARGTWPAQWHKHTPTLSRAGALLEVYATGRYLTVTGDTLVEDEPVIAECQAALDWLATLKPKPAAAPTPPPSRAPSHVALADDELLDRARRASNGSRFSRLFDTPLDESEDESSGDLALLNLLAFWANGDRAQMARLFQRSARGQREKALRVDYVERTIDAAMRDRTEYYTPRGSATRPTRSTVAVADDPASPGTPRRYMRTDLGNAERFADQHAGRVLYSDRDGWMVYNGLRWERDREGAIGRAAKMVVRGIYTEAERCEDPDERKALSAWACSSESAARIRALIDLARWDDRIAIKHERFDADRDDPEPSPPAPSSSSSSTSIAGTGPGRTEGRSSEPVATITASGASARTPSAVAAAPVRSSAPAASASRRSQST